MTVSMGNHLHTFCHGYKLNFRSKQATIQRVASVLTLRVCLLFFGVFTAPIVLLPIGILIPSTP